MNTMAAGVRGVEKEISNNLDTQQSDTTFQKVAT
jgi:hypothetical protein